MQQSLHGDGEPVLDVNASASGTFGPRVIIESAKGRLRNSPHLSLQRIWCEYDRGELFLRGQVPSFYYKQLAQEAVAGLEGVRQVVNDIEVVW
jgi:osmotically-inducible protein OsmY